MQIIRVAHLIDPAAYDAVTDMVLFICATILLSSIVGAIGRCRCCKKKL